MSLIQLSARGRVHLFPGLGTRSLCGLTRTVDAPGTAVGLDAELGECCRKVARVNSRASRKAGAR